MAKLQDILYKVHLKQVQGSTAIDVTDIQIDSRKVAAGAVFVAIHGAQSDGHQFIDKAVSSGAVAVVCEEMPAAFSNGITYLQVNNAQEAVAYMAHNFYGEPSKKIKLTGVTGTNGKTTIATILFKLFTQLGYTCGLISTVQNQIADKIIPATHTTPDAVNLNALLKQMYDEGCTHVFMECSSHAIHQHRITGLQFTGGLFSNITHDHLDYHKTFEEYINVKKRFFDALPSSAFAISNADDKRGEVMLQNTHAQKYFYSLKTTASFKGKILENALTGLVMLVNDKEVHFRLIGEFNAYNLLAVYGAAVCLGEESEKILTALSLLSGAEGRFDYSISSGLIIGIVDYAHTPDALEIKQSLQWIFIFLIVCLFCHLFYQLLFFIQLPLRRTLQLRVQHSSTTSCTPPSQEGKPKETHRVSKLQTPNSKLQTPNSKLQTPNSKLQTHILSATLNFALLLLLFLFISS